MVNLCELVDGLQPLGLIAPLGDPEQPPGHGMLERFPPFLERLHDDVQQPVLVLRIESALAQRLSVDVMLDVDVIWALPVNV